jgi:hypothetical protein
MLFRFTRMVLDINNQMLTFNFSLMNETLKQKSAVDRGFYPSTLEISDTTSFISYVSFVVITNQLL